MATQRAKTENLLYLDLDQITLQGAPSLEYKLRLFVESEERELRTKNNQTWTPAQRLKAFWTSHMRVEIQMEEKREVINLQGLFNEDWSSKGCELTVLKVVVVGKYRGSLELRFSASATAKPVRSSLDELEGLVEKYSPPMKLSTERTLENCNKYGVALSELNPISRVVFSVANITFELLKEQCKIEQRLSGLCDQLQRTVRLADKVTSEVVCQETEFLEKTMPRMFEVVQTVANFSCDYVKRAKMADGLLCLEATEEMERELTKVIDDLDREMDRTALSETRQDEMQFLYGRLKPYETSYHLDLCCMEGTRESLLNRIMVWVTDNNTTNTYWIYGLPGIGKTSLAHSICAILHDREQLAGAFFCRRDDPNLSEPRNILPTLICSLASTFRLFRTTVAKHLRNNPDLTPESMKDTLILDSIRSLPRNPDRTLVFVVDAIDECGDDQSRPYLLKVLTDVAIQAPWLKVIITSRPEVDIQRFFDAATRSSHLRYDLATDHNPDADLRNFAQSQFDQVASLWCLPTPWPEESLFNLAISRANGLFIFIKTLVLALKRCSDPEEFLEATLQEPHGTGLEPLYGLYSSILKAQLVRSDVNFQRMIGVVLATAPYRPLDEETIGELAGVKPNHVRKWVNDLSSLLYRDEQANGGIRVRHLSISEFLVSDRCEYQVSLGDANRQLGVASLKTMVDQLRFNICKLEDSRLANTAVQDLPPRIEHNISEALQYSSLYWSNHLCSTPDTGDQRIWQSLKEFFEGVYPVFWVEVLSILGMVPIGAPSLRRVISWVKDVDSPLLERIQDVCRFVITFHTPISISAPHIYLSARPFLPSQSPLSTTFSTKFTKGIKIQSGRMLSWPAPPLEWMGHELTINCIRYSPDGCRIVTASDDAAVRFWDAGTCAVVGEPLSGHSFRVQAVAYSPDGRRVISGSEDHTIRIWDAETFAAVGTPLRGHTGSVWTVAYSPDGRHIISGSSDKTIRTWGAETGGAVGEPLKVQGGIVRTLAYSPDGRRIVSGCSDKVIRIWDVETSAIVGKPLEGHSGEVWSVAYSPDGRHISSGSEDMTVRTWDADTGAVVGRPLVGHTGEVQSVAYSPDGRYIISGSRDGAVRTWDANTGAPVGKPLVADLRSVHSVAYSPDGQYIISGSSKPVIRIWDAKTGAAVGMPMEGHSGGVWSVAYTPDGRHIISGASDRTVRISDAETGTVVGKPLEGHTRGVRSIASSPDGRRIVSGSMDGVQIWDTEKGTAVGKRIEGDVLRVGYSPDGRHICGSVGKAVRIWDAETGATVGRPLEGHTKIVASLAYSPDGRHIVSGSEDETIRIWDAGTGSAVGNPLEGHTGSVLSVAYSPDGRCIISGSHDGTVRRWDAATGAVVGKPLEGHTKEVQSVTYSPDGRYIASASSDKTVRIWDTDTGAVVGKPLEGHTKEVRSITYSPDGRYIASASSDKTVRIWDARAGVAVSKPLVPAELYAQPDQDGWVRDSEGSLLYWVPPDCRAGLHSPALLTIPSTSHIRSVHLDFDDFGFGTSWVQIFNSTQP